MELKRIIKGGNMIGDKLFIAFVIFGIVDLTCVGLVYLNVIKYLREIDKRLKFIGTGLQILFCDKKQKDVNLIKKSIIKQKNK